MGYNNLMYAIQNKEQELIKKGQISILSQRDSSENDAR